MSNPRLPKRKATRVLFLFLAVSGAIALLCTLLWPRERLLLSMAHKRPLFAETYFSEHDQYGAGGWRSDHEQMLLHRTPGEDHATVWVRDILTGQETPLQPFNDRFASQLKLVKMVPHVSARRGATGENKSVDYLLPTQQFSPDGKWLLWRDGQTWRAFALDGSVPREWPRDPQENRYRRYINWVFNGQEWLQPRFDSTFHINGAMLHSLEANAPEEDRMFAQSAGGWVLGTTRERHLLTYDLVYRPAIAPYTFYDTDLATNHAPTRKYVIMLPPETYGVDVRLSPDGTRLLWNLQIRQEPPGPLLAQNFLRRFGMKTRLQNALWVSNTDGTNLREVGHITAEPLPPPPPAKFAVTTAIRIQYQRLQQQLTTRLYGVQWLPDSKHALFLRGNEVYEVDIE